MATEQQVHPVVNFREIELNRIRISKRHLRSEIQDIAGLSSSISDHGLLHPLVVRRCYDATSDEFEVISGVRRLRALQQMKAQFAACQVIEASDRKAFEIALSENLQRHQISPLEEALAFQHYIKVCKWGRVKNLAKKIGKSEEYVNHRLRLLELPDSILSMIGSELSTSQAEELSWIEDKEIQTNLAKLAAEKKLTVRQLHQLAMHEKVYRSQELKSPATDTFQPSGDDLNWLPMKIKDESIRQSPRRMFQNNIVALRLLLAYFDDRIAEMERVDGTKEVTAFMVKQRYLLHQILDNFIKALCDY